VVIKINNRLYRARTKVAKALANETRLQIIDILAEEKHCVYEITNILGASQSSVSKHLEILRTAGIVDSEKNGLNVIYNLRTPCVKTFFECIDNILYKDLKRKEKELGLIKNN